MECLLSFGGSWALIFLCWLPAFIATWPGVFVIDNVFQMKWYLEGNVSAHHPILHTYLLGNILEIGRKIFGSWEAGLGIFSIVQMFFLAGVFAYVIKRLKEYIGSKACLAALVFYAVVPYHPVSAFTATKDTIFAGLFLLTVLETYCIVQDLESFFLSWKKMLRYVILVFFMCAFRNTGIYIFVFSLPAFVVVCRKYWKRAVSIGLGCLVMWVVFTGPVYAFLHAEKGSSAEMLSVPMQQMAHVMMDARDEFTSEEWKLAVQYIPDYEKYAPRVADPVKDTFNAELFDRSPAKFVALWGKMAARCPVLYLEAFLDMNQGFWDPFVEYPDPGTYLAYIPYHSADAGQVGVLWEGQVFVQQSLRPPLSTLYEKMTESGSYNRIPGMKLLYSSAAAFWLIIAGIIFCVVKKKWRMAAPFFLLIGLWGTLMVSPVVVFRYGYPLITCLPVVWAMCRGKDICGLKGF